MVADNTPKVFDIDEVFIKYPTDYNECMNTVLVQELIRYNKMLEVMAKSLVLVKKALKGLIVMSEELEHVTDSLFKNTVFLFILIS